MLFDLASSDGIDYLVLFRNGRSSPWLHPLEITTREHPPRKPRAYQITQWYRAWPPPEDADECVSIIRPGVYPATDAFAATHLLAMSDALHVDVSLSFGGP